MAQVCPWRWLPSGGEIPDAYREGDYLNMAAKGGKLLAGAEAVASVLPFGKAFVRGVREIPGVIKAAGNMADQGIYRMDDFMAPRAPKLNNNVLFDEVVKYLEGQGK